MPNVSTSGIVKYKDKNKADLSEREILYKVLFDMKRDLSELKKITFELMQKDGRTEVINNKLKILKESEEDVIPNTSLETQTIDIEESLSLFEHEKKLIEKSLIKHKGKRKSAADELGISEEHLQKTKEFEAGMKQFISILLISLFVSSCKIYSFTGVNSINAKTVSVSNFITSTANSVYIKSNNYRRTKRSFFVTN